MANPDPSRMSTGELKKLTEPKQADGKPSSTPAAKADATPPRGNPVVRAVTAPVRFAVKAVMEVAKGTLRLGGVVIGGALEMPVVKQVWLGARLAGGALLDIPTGNAFHPSNPIGFDKEGPAVIIGPGVGINGKREYGMQLFVEEKFGVGASTVIKNRTHWFRLGDLLQALGNEIGLIDRPARDMAKAIRAGIKEKGEVFVVVHSQGSGYFKQSLALLSVEERSRVHVLTVGAQWIIDSGAENLGSAANVWNKGDFIPTLGNRLRMVSNLLLPWNWGRLSQRDVVRGDTGTRWGVDLHRFASYEEAVFKWVQEIRHRWNGEVSQSGY